jgi:hypothetical protein
LRLVTVVPLNVPRAVFIDLDAQRPKGLRHVGDGVYGQRS